jgi:hypothetical protein
MTSWRYKSLLGATVACLFLTVGLLAQEEPEGKKLPLLEMVEALKTNPVLKDQSFIYDPGFQAVGSFSIHNHFAKRVCLGYLVTDGKTLSYRFIRAWPGLGSDNDAFQTPLENVVRVEYKYYKASKGFMDYFPERLSVKVFFEAPISGIMADWKKEDMEFDIWDVNFGYTLMDLFKTLNVKMEEKG